MQCRRVVGYRVASSDVIAPEEIVQSAVTDGSGQRLGQDQTNPRGVYPVAAYSVNNDRDRGERVALRHGEPLPLRRQSRHQQIVPDIVPTVTMTCVAVSRYA